MATYEDKGAKLYNLPESPDIVIRHHNNSDKKTIIISPLNKGQPALQRARKQNTTINNVCLMIIKLGTNTQRNKQLL